jgi:hypothetical protein
MWQTATLETDLQTARVRDADFSAMSQLTNGQQLAETARTMAFTESLLSGESRQYDHTWSLWRTWSTYGFLQISARPMCSRL